jgi:hypothetical protein
VEWLVLQLTNNELPLSDCAPVTASYEGEGGDEDKDTKVDGGEKTGKERRV